jgi:glc operon protein GlcG
MKIISMQTFMTLSHTDAQKAIDAIQAELVRRGKAGVVAVADAHGELIALLRMDGAPLASITIAINKAFTAAREGKATMDIGAKFKDKGYDFMWFGDGRYVGWGGGVPVLVNGVSAGAVAVSGLTQGEDHEIAGIGVSALAS